MQILPHRFLPLALALAAALSAGGAFAQLKLPGSSGSSLGLGTQAPAAPAPAEKSAAPAERAESARSATGQDTSAMEKAATTAAMGWLLLLDRGDWGTAWDSSAPMFHKSMPLARWMDAIPKARAPLGALIERTPLDAGYKRQLPGHPAGDYVTVLFKSRFEKKPEVQELVTLVREPDGKWHVTGYGIL